MQFRVRSSSKKSGPSDLSFVEFPTSKSLMAPDSHLPGSLGSRIDQLEATLSAFQQSHRREREIANSGYAQSQRRLDKAQYKLFAVEQDVRQLSEVREIRHPREIAAPLGVEPSKNEMMLLKQVLMQEKEAQKQLAKHQNSQIEQLSHKLMRQEQEVREMMTEQRIQSDQRFNGQEEELREVEGLKNRKMEQQYDMMKGVIANAERKIYEELERKIRNEAVIKDFVEEKVSQAKEELACEHRQTLASEGKFIKETRQSLETLFSISNSTKKHLSEELAETQKLTTGSIKRLSMTLDITREKATDEHKLALELHQQVANELIDLRNFVTTRLEETRHRHNEQAQQERVGLVPTSPKVDSSVDEERLSHLEKEINHWKSITEQKNLNVFKEISNTLKIMKVEWRKENDQMVSEVAALNDTLKTLKKAGPNELKKSVQALVSIFNNEFDVLAEELETLTDMIALAKRENEKQFKEELLRIKNEMREELSTLLAQKGKENALLAERIAGRSEENMKNHTQKEIKFSADQLAQKGDKNANDISRLDTSLKKMNLLTSSQLEDYSLKLKGFNTSYKEYLQEQRKEDMKKRMELEEAMRKNSSNLMDICYKKSQFLMDGLKNNIQISQMKEKVEAAQALDAAKDELKKDVQGARQEWQKELREGVDKLTKERETSQEMIQETTEQSINNAKRNLTNEMGNNKLEMDEKLNYMKTKSEEKHNEQEEAQIELKNTVLQMLRDEKKLTEQKGLKNKAEADAKIGSIEKTISDREAENSTRQAENSTRQAENRAASQKQMEGFVATEISKADTAQKEELSKVRTSLEQALTQDREGANAKFTKVEDQAAKAHTIQVEELGKVKSLVEESNEQANGKFRKLEEGTKQSLEDRQKVNKDNLSKEAAVEKQRQDNSEGVEAKIKSMQVRIDEINNQMDKVDKEQVQTEKDKTTTSAELDQKQAKLETKVEAISRDLQLMNQDTIGKIEEVNQKIAESKASSDQKEGEGKKVGESSLNQMKKDLEQQISSLEQKVDQIQEKDRGEDNEEAIGAIRKSVNKLEAMVFSEQAKNKALFDQLTQDVDKVNDNLSMLVNEIRD